MDGDEITCVHILKSFSSFFGRMQGGESSGPYGDLDDDVSTIYVYTGSILLSQRCSRARLLKSI